MGEGTGEDRGRGLPLMRALMDEVEVETTEAGTSVVLRRRLRSPAAAVAG